MGLPALEHPQPLQQEALGPCVQCSPPPADKALDPAFSVRRRRWNAKASMNWPVLALELPPLAYTMQDTKQEVKQEARQGANHETEQRACLDTDTEVQVEQGTSVQRSPALSTSPGSVTSESSRLSMDSAYQDFCSRREAFLNQCCQLD